MNRNDGLLVRAKDVAKMLNVSVRTVWTWRDIGRLPAPVKIGGCVRWRRQDVEEWIEEGCPDIGKAQRDARLRAAFERSASDGQKHN